MLPLVGGATPAREVVRSESYLGVPGADVPHPFHLLRLTATADGNGNAEGCGPLPEGVAAGIVGRRRCCPN